MVHAMMAGSVEQETQEGQVLHKLRVDPELEKCVEFKVNQVDGRRQRECQWEVEEL